MKLIRLLLAGMILSSCSLPKPECVNTEQYFSSNSYESQEYQNKVISVLQNDSPEAYRYFFVTFTGQDTTHLIVNMRSEQNCFDAKMFVTNWDELGGMRKVNGLSYPKELNNLVWEIIGVDGQQEIHYLDMRFIID